MNENNSSTLQFSHFKAKKSGEHRSVERRWRNAASQRTQNLISLEMECNLIWELCRAAEAPFVCRWLAGWRSRALSIPHNWNSWWRCEMNKTEIFHHLWWVECTRCHVGVFERLVCFWKQGKSIKIAWSFLFPFPRLLMCYYHSRTRL